MLIDELVETACDSGNDYGDPQEEVWERINVLLNEVTHDDV